MTRYAIALLALGLIGCASNADTKTDNTLTEQPAAPSTEAADTSEYADTGPGEKLGSLPRETIQLVVRQNRDRIRQCYQRQLRTNPTLGGKVVVQFKIVGDGTVSFARITDSTLGDTNVESCIRHVVQSWTFKQPEGGGYVIVNYPFNLGAA